MPSDSPGTCGEGCPVARYLSLPLVDSAGLLRHPSLGQTGDAGDDLFRHSRDHHLHSAQAHVSAGGPTDGDVPWLCRRVGMTMS